MQRTPDKYYAWNVTHEDIRYLFKSKDKMIQHGLDKITAQEPEYTWELGRCEANPSGPFAYRLVYIGFKKDFHRYSKLIKAIDFEMLKDKCIADGLREAERAYTDYIWEVDEITPEYGGTYYTVHYKGIRRVRYSSAATNLQDLPIDFSFNASHPENFQPEITPKQSTCMNKHYAITLACDEINTINVRFTPDGSEYTYLTTFTPEVGDYVVVPHHAQKNVFCVVQVTEVHDVPAIEENSTINYKWALLNLGKKPTTIHEALLEKEKKLTKLLAASNRKAKREKMKTEFLNFVNESDAEEIQRISFTDVNVNLLATPEMEDNNE